jgi:hypothetical protein
MRNPTFLFCFAAAASAQVTTEDTFAAQIAAIVPTADETGWRAVPWRTELRAALAEADQKQRPVLLWAMNGHPLGQC